MSADEPRVVRGYGGWRVWWGGKPVTDYFSTESAAKLRCEEIKKQHE